MTLETTLYNIGEIAIKNNLCNSYYAGGSLYELNSEIIDCYPLIFLTPAGDDIARENVTRFNVTIYYVDRLWDDDRNETDICSAAIETLKNIKRQLPYLDWVANVEEDPSIRLFTETERMSDRVAGAYMTIYLDVIKASTCPEFLDELGRPMGNYIPGNINVLDSYATKAWVILQKYADKPWVLEQIENIKMSGGTTDKQVLEMIASALTEYTKTNNFATINNSAITEGGNFQLVERSEFDNYSAMTAEELDKIIKLIGNIPMSSVTEDIAALSSVTNSHTEDINTLSALTNSHTENIAALSSVTNSHAEDIAALSSVTNNHTENINALSALTSSHTQDIVSLSAKTSEIADNLGVLSDYTHESVSSITHSVETLSAGTETAISGLTELSSVTENILSREAVIYDYSEWRAADKTGKLAMRVAWTNDFNSGKNVYMKAITSNKATVLLKLEQLGLYDQFRYASDAYVCHVSINDDHAVGAGEKVNITNILTSLPTASAKVLGGVKVGSGLTMKNQVLSTQYQIWVGTKEEYDALGTYDSMTFYVITGLN